ncbi:MAG TPA: zinc dependent phospholipase C family protein [Sphingobacteriaceae bacterium]|nr:zinc dependent phospholipase C family protein [Sphingobacteriaceae bacterium]
MNDKFLRFIKLYHNLLPGLKLINRHIVFVIFLICGYPLTSNAYSLLTHEAIIDVSWKKSIEPLLLKKYPNTTESQLFEAHSYAYGGAIMPDIGYSPFGSMLYTDFVHNVRTGDYIEALLEAAENVNEYAFALGSLAHYMADNYGHSIGTNIAVPLTYPKVKAKFGDTVTYADHNISHSRMELAFDVLQTARGNYASKAYHDFIGFNIARPVVEKAFFKTYGIDVNDVFGSMSVAISTFRWTIKSFLPTIVRTAWATKKSELRKTNPGVTAQSFKYRMNNKAYYSEFGRDHQKAGFIPTILGWLVPVLPKIGPLAKLKFKAPTPETEKLFIKSFDSTLVHYDAALKQLNKSSLDLQNRTLDTGQKTEKGEYSIADNNYAEFLLKLKENKFENITPEIRDNLLSFYKSGKPPKISKKYSKKWSEVTMALNMLAAVNR